MTEMQQTRLLTFGSCLHVKTSTYNNVLMCSADYGRIYTLAARLVCSVTFSLLVCGRVGNVLICTVMSLAASVLPCEKAAVM